MKKILKSKRLIILIVVALLVVTVAVIALSRNPTKNNPIVDSNPYEVEVSAEDKQKFLDQLNKARDQSQ